jgi:hypothetical protein
LSTSSTSSSDQVATPTPTGSASIAKPAPAPEVSSDGVEGAKAFVRYYSELLNYAYATGDSRELRRLSSDACLACQRSINAIRHIYEAGGRAEGGWFTVLSIEAIGADPGPRVRLTVTRSGTEFKTLDAKGKVLHSEPAVDAFAATWEVNKGAGIWIVRGIQNT